MSKNQILFSKFLKGPRAAAAAAYVSGDATQVTALSAASGAATFLGPGGGIVAGARKVIGNNERGAKNFAPGGTSRFKVAQEAAADGLAFWTGIQSARVRLKGKPGKVPMDLRVTEVFQLQRGQWKLIHRHADMLAKTTARGK